MSTETQFTPGPWEADAIGYVHAGNVRIAIVGGFVIYPECVATSGEMWTANARLIAAAPDMYAALKDSCDIAMRMAAKADIPYYAEFGEIAQTLDAALAKASGMS